MNKKLTTKNNKSIKKKRLNRKNTNRKSKITKTKPKKTKPKKTKPKKTKPKSKSKPKKTKPKLKNSKPKKSKPKLKKTKTKKTKPNKFITKKKDKKKLVMIENQNNQNNQNNIYESTLKHCSPKVNVKEPNKRSCFDDEVLLSLIKSWNNTNKHDKININKKNNINSNSELWYLLNQKMSNKCNSEICWIKDQKLKNNLSKKIKNKIQSSIRPFKPKEWDKNEREWLNTLDIANVMKQYEQKYHDFKFIGPVPIDFDLKDKENTCMVSNLCKIDVSNLIKNKIKKLGIIFNLDKHNQSGSHWIAMYMSIPKNLIGYWDSYGYKPPEEIMNLMNKLKSQCSNLGYKPNIKINNIRHQYKGSECGVYSMHFIIEQLNGKSFDDVTKHVITDDEMWENRKKYFIYNDT